MNVKKSLIILIGGFIAGGLVTTGLFAILETFVSAYHTSTELYANHSYINLELLVERDRKHAYYYLGAGTVILLGLLAYVMIRKTNQNQ